MGEQKSRFIYHSLFSIITGGRCGPHRGRRPRPSRRRELLSRRPRLQSEGGAVGEMAAAVTLQSASAAFSCRFSSRKDEFRGSREGTPVRSPEGRRRGLPECEPGRRGGDLPDKYCCFFLQTPCRCHRHLPRHTRPPPEAV